MSVCDACGRTWEVGLICFFLAVAIQRLARGDYRCGCGHAMTSHRAAAGPGLRRLVQCGMAHVHPEGGYAECRVWVAPLETAKETI